MKNDTIPWPLVKELAFKMSDGAIKANSKNVEDFIFNNDKYNLSLVKEVFRRVINIGPEIFSTIIEKEVTHYPDKFNFKETEIDADTCRKIINLLFQSFCKANPKIMVWWNGHKGAHKLFKYLFNYGLDQVKGLLDTYEPGVSDIVLIKHKILWDCLINKNIPDPDSLTISNKATSYSFGGLSIEDLSNALRFLGVPITNHHPHDKNYHIPTEPGSTFHNLKKVHFLPDTRRSRFSKSIADVDKICLSKGADTSSAEEVLDYVLDICIQGLLQGDRDPLSNLRNALNNRNTWLVCRNAISKAGKTQKQSRFILELKGYHHSFNGRLRSIVDFAPCGHPQTAKNPDPGVIQTIPKFKRHRSPCPEV